MYVALFKGLNVTPPPSENRKRAEAYVQFCDLHGIKPFKLLAAATKLRYSHPISQKEIRDYFASDEATQDMEKALADWRPRLSEQERERFFREAWPLRYTFMFPGKSQLPKLGTLGDFQVLVSGKQTKVVGWTRELVAKHVASALASLPEEERAHHFPFRSFKGKGNSYQDFQSAVRRQPPLPMVDSIHHKTNKCIFSDIYQLNKAVAQKLRVPYTVPTAESVVEQSVTWWLKQGKSIEDFRIEDVKVLRSEEVIPDQIFRRKGGLFTSWHDLANQIRKSDGIDRLPKQVFGYAITREEIQKRLEKRWPRVKDGVPQPPPKIIDLRQLSKDRVLNSHLFYIGPSFQFTSLADLHRAIGYPRIRIPERNPGSNVPRTPPREAFELIDQVVREMYKIGMKPHNEIAFSRVDFDEAKRLGIVDSASFIVGPSQWYSEQSYFDAAYEHPYSISLVELMEGRTLTLEEQDALGDRAMADIELHIKASGKNSYQLKEADIDEWSKDGTCPRMSDIDELFGGLHAVQVYLDLVAQDKNIGSR